MKKVHPLLFDEMRSSTSHVVAGWLLIRKDGTKLGFTSGDEPFDYDGVHFSPTNSFSGSASQSKNNLSVDNMNAVGLVTDQINKKDLLGGTWDNAEVRLFWIRPDKPEWGVVPIRGGRLGEIKCKGNVFETELRSVLQNLQQPFGKFYTLECRAQLGDKECKVNMDPPTWAAGKYQIARIQYEQGVGDVVKPTVDNGFWYECVDAPNSVSSDAEQNTLSTGLQNKLIAVRTANGLN